MNKFPVPSGPPRGNVIPRPEKDGDRNRGSMPAATNIVELRRLLAERFPQAHAPSRPTAPPGSPTGVPGLDALLDGGLPRGAVTELVGDGDGSGSAQVLHTLLQTTAAAGRFAALVDGADSFDVDAAAPGVLARMLWVRCTTADQALKAGDLLLRDRNLPLVLLDLKLNPLRELRRIPPSTWFRFSRLVEHHGSTLLVITPHALVGAADLRIRVAARLDLESLAAGPESVTRRLPFESLRTAESGMQPSQSEAG